MALCTVCSNLWSYKKKLTQQEVGVVEGEEGLIIFERYIIMWCIIQDYLIYMMYNWNASFIILFHLKIFNWQRWILLFEFAEQQNWFITSDSTVNPPISCTARFRPHIPSCHTHHLRDYLDLIYFPVYFTCWQLIDDRTKKIISVRVCKSLYVTSRKLTKLRSTPENIFFSGCSFLSWLENAQ